MKLPNLPNIGTGDVKNMLQKLVHGIILSKEVVIAVVVLLGLAGFCWVVWYCMRRGYPRPMWINRALDLNAIMDDVYRDMNNIRNMIQGSAALNDTDFGRKMKIPQTIQLIEDMLYSFEDKDGLIDVRSMRKPAPLRACVSTYTKDRAQPQTDDLKADQAKIGTIFEVYLEYDDIMNRWLDKKIHANALKSFRKYSECGTEYLEGEEAVISAIQRLGPVQAELNEANDAIDALAVSFDDDAAFASMNKTFMVDLCSGIKRLHFYICGEGCYKLKEMYESRRFSTVGYFITLVRPFVDRILVREIWARWLDIFNQAVYNKQEEKFRAWWNYIEVGDIKEKDAYKPEENGGRSMLMAGVWPGLSPAYFLDQFAEMIDDVVINPVEGTGSRPVTGGTDPQYAG